VDGSNNLKIKFDISVGDENATSDMVQYTHEQGQKIGI
jgi:hypothetical protein